MYIFFLVLVYYYKYVFLSNRERKKRSNGVGSIIRNFTIFKK